MTDTEFKTQYRNHKLSFERDRYEGQIELSKYIWSLKRSSILDRATSYSPIIMHFGEILYFETKRKSISEQKI